MGEVEYSGEGSFIKFVVAGAIAGTAGEFSVVLLSGALWVVSIFFFFVFCFFFFLVSGEFSNAVVVRWVGGGTEHCGMFPLDTVKVRACCSAHSSSEA